MLPTPPLQNKADKMISDYLNENIRPTAGRFNPTESFKVTEMPGGHYGSSRSQQITSGSVIGPVWKLFPHMSKPDSLRACDREELAT